MVLPFSRPIGHSHFAISVPHEPPKVVVYTGPARSGKTRELLGRYSSILSRRSADGGQETGHASTASLRTLWIAPTASDAASVRGQLIAGGLDGCFSPGVMTFHTLARHILDDAGSRLRLMRQPAQRELLRRVVRWALDGGHLTYFREAAHRSAFIDLLAEHLHELKRSDLSPDSYAKARPLDGNADEHRELALLYRELEQWCSEKGLVDTEGELLAAREALAAGNAPSLQHLELVFVDGFTDFTRVQLDLVRRLAACAHEVAISLPSESRAEPTPRSDLFAKTTHTLGELKQSFPQLAVRELEPRPLSVPAIDHAVRNVFRNPKHIAPPSNEALETVDRIEVVAAASAHDEIVQIARRIKHRLASGSAKPGDIVVVFRSLADAAPRVSEVFEQFGIPYHLDARPRLVAAPAVKTLLSLLRLDDDDWPFRRVTSTITNTLLTAFEPAARQAAEWLVRDLQIASGRETLRNRVAHLASNDTPAKKLPEHLAWRVAAAKAALPILERMAKALDELPQEATLNEWAAALERFAAKLGIESLSQTSRVPGATPQQSSTDWGGAQGTRYTDSENGRTSGDVDQLAWQSLKQSLAAVDRLDAWLGLPARVRSRRELLHAMLDIAAHEPLPIEDDDVGRVRVVSAPAARTIEARHVYLAGMSEQSFPSSERAGRLATEIDYRTLARQVKKRPKKSGGESLGPTRAQGEMLLFYEVLSRAEQSLTISYPALDDRAQVLPPSPYVLDVQRVFGAENTARLAPAPPQLSPVPPEGNVRSIADWRIHAIARAIDKEPDRRELAGIMTTAATRELGLSLDAALRAIHDRARGESFGPFEGLLTSPAIAARLAQRFGANHYWSPSQWETYATCPYRFFLEAVLQLEPLGDLLLETDYTRRGSRLHHVLATFHRQWQSLRGHAASADEEQARFMDQLRRVIDDRIATAGQDGIDAALVELDRRQIAKWGEKHFGHQENYNGTCSKRGVQMQPAHLEFRFGPPRAGAEDDDPDSIDTAFVIDIGGEKIRVAGQIDRIDVGQVDGRTVFSVIDYKSSKTNLRGEDIESGQRLQLPLYVEAAQALVFNGEAAPFAAGYWSMAAGFDTKGALAVKVESDPEEHWQNIRKAVHQRITQFVRDIRNGVFPVASRDENCTSYCGFSTICRVAQVRSLGKVHEPEGGGSSAEDAKKVKRTKPGGPVGRG